MLLSSCSFGMSGDIAVGHHFEGVSAVQAMQRYRLCGVAGRAVRRGKQCEVVVGAIVFCLTFTGGI